MDGLWHVPFLLVILLNVLSCSASGVCTTSDGFSGNESSCVTTYNDLVVAFNGNDPVSGNIQEIIRKFKGTNKKAPHLVWVHYCYTLPCNFSDANFTYLWADSSIFLLIDYDVFLNMTFGLAGINEPERANLIIPLFCDEIDNDTINTFLLRLTTELTSSSIIGENDWSTNALYYATRYTNEFNEGPTIAEYQYLLYEIIFWLSVSCAIALIGINAVVCIPGYREIIGKFLHFCIKRVNTLLRLNDDNNYFTTEPNKKKEYNNYFFSFLQRMVFPIMLATFIYILVQDIQNFDRQTWIDIIYLVYISVPLTLLSAIFSTICLLNQNMPNNFNILITFVFLFPVVWVVCLMIPHGFWLFIALLAYPGQILITSLYIVPALLLITVVWNIILELVESIYFLVGAFITFCCKDSRGLPGRKCICNDMNVNFCFVKLCENKKMYHVSLLCDILSLFLIGAFIGLFCGLLIRIVYDLIQFIHLHVELNVGIFGSLVANTVVVVVTSVLFLVNFFIIGHVRKKSNAKPYTAPFIYKIKKKCCPFINQGLKKTCCENCINKLKSIFCCNYKQKSIQLMLQRAVQLEFKEIIDCEEIDLTQSNEQILKSIQEKLVEKIEEIVGTENETPQQVVPNADVRQVQDTGCETPQQVVPNADVGQVLNTGNETPRQVVNVHNAGVGQVQDTGNETPQQVVHNADVEQVQDTGCEILPIGIIKIAVHNGIQQAIKEEIHGISLLTPVFSQDNQNALQEAVKHEIFDKLKNTDNHPVDVNKINNIMNPQQPARNNNSSSAPGASQPPPDPPLEPPPDPPL